MSGDTACCSWELTNEVIVKLILIVCQSGVWVARHMNQRCERKRCHAFIEKSEDAGLQVII